MSEFDFGAYEGPQDYLTGERYPVPSDFIAFPFKGEIKPPILTWRGLSYSEEEISDILANPTITSGFPPDEYCAEKRQLGGERITTDLPPAQRIYKGPRYSQDIEESTCLPWAITNASQTMGIEASPEVTTQLVNATFPKSGLSFVEANKILDVERAPIQGEILEDSAPKVYSTDARIERVVTTEWTFEAGQMIQKTLDNDEGIVVMSEPTQRARCDDRHVTCIAGYKIDPRGAMDVQVIDSGWGVAGSSMKPLEDVLQEAATTHFPLMRLRRRTQ